MSFVSFEAPEPGWGVVLGQGVVMGRRLLKGQFRTLKEVVAAEALEAALHEAPGQPRDFDVADLTFLPTVPDPTHILCAGLNYSAHAAESGKAVPAAPRMFLRSITSLTGHRRPVIRPKVSERLDFEGELAVVIGRGGRHIPESEAMSYVAGYTCFMDGSVRDWQEHSVTTGKNFFSTGALGPYLVPATQLPDPTSLTLVARLNGTEVQRVTTDRMIHTIPHLIAYLSAMTPLFPGDVIATGTPEGIGNRRSPPLYMKSGDRIEVEISGVGLLSNNVEDETAA